MLTLSSEKFESKYILPNSSLYQAPAEDTKRRDKMVGHPRAPSCWLEQEIFYVW